MSYIEYVLPVFTSVLEIVLQGGTTADILARANQSVELKDAVEALLRESASPEDLEAVTQIARQVSLGADFLADVADGELNTLEARI
jgi:hypothetical protein